MRPRASFRPYVGLAFAVVAFSASLVWGVHRLAVLQEARFVNESAGSRFVAEPLSEAQKRYVEYILSGGRHLLALIDEVLDLAKI
jgi:signal transduction histidine kinase